MLLSPFIPPSPSSPTPVSISLFCMSVSVLERKWSRSVVSDSLRLRGLEPTRLLCPWDFPGKSTGVGCHFLLQCMKVKSESEVAQSCPTLSDPVDWSLPGSSVHGIFQARVLGWGAIAVSECHCMLLLLSHFGRVRLCATP